MKTNTFSLQKQAVIFAAAFIASTILLATASAQADPFAAPPKNLKAEDAGGYTIQAQSGEEEVVEMTAEEETVTAEETSIKTGTLQMNVEGEYILDTGTEIIMLNTGKDLQNYIGEEISIETVIDENGGMIIKNFIVGGNQEATGPLSAANTGPNAWLISGLILIIISAFAAMGDHKRQRAFAFVRKKANRFTKK
jgi:hypothetical protein